jgi:hypothetical protein
MNSPGSAGAAVRPSAGPIEVFVFRLSAMRKKFREGLKKLMAAPLAIRHY